MRLFLLRLNIVIRYPVWLAVDVLVSLLNGEKFLPVHRKTLAAIRPIWMANKGG